MNHILDTKKERLLFTHTTFPDFVNDEKLLFTSSVSPVSPAGSDILQIRRKSDRYMSPRPEGRGNKLQL